MANGTLLIKVASSRIIFTEILRCPPYTLGEISSVSGGHLIFENIPLYKEE